MVSDEAQQPTAPKTDNTGKLSIKCVLKLETDDEIYFGPFKIQQFYYPKQQQQQNN